MNTELLRKIKTKALRKGEAARGASINETLLMVDLIVNMTSRFKQIADNYELCGVCTVTCECCTAKYPMDWVINNKCPFCFSNMPV